MKRSKFNLNHYRLQSGRMGELLPVSCMEVLPGDSLRMKSTAMLRLSPMVKPIMHPIHLRLHTFFVPNRIVWDEWENFIVDMNTELQVPTYTGPVGPGQALDYLGVAPADYGDGKGGVNLLPLRAYNLIYNEFFRDQDLDEEANIEGLAIKKCRWEKDYFTTARLEAQSGATETVQIEFDQDVPVFGYGIDDDGIEPTNNNVGVIDTTGNTRNYVNAHITNSNAAQNAAYVEMDAGGTRPNLRIEAGTAGGSMDINEWRRAMAWQRLAEHRNKYGSRYTDYLAFLGVNSSDSRLQRPEYLGGGSTTVNISEVLTTADTETGDGGRNAGELVGHGIAGHSTRPFRRFFEEHGHVITLASVRPKTIYNDTVTRNFYRRKPADYWQKEMEIMGDQPVFRGEVTGASVARDAIFGYVDRHREYREMRSDVAGEMRNVTNDWHISRRFSSEPVLNSAFVECNPEEDRIFADTNLDTFQMFVSHKVTARRLVSKRARV